MRTKARILAIDDTPFNLLTLGSALSDEFDLQIATSGREGLSLAKASLPDIILLDVMMPEMDGYEVCRRLKDDPQLCAIPVIFVTALNDERSEVMGLSLGAVDYLTKPINVEVARRRVRNVLEREQLRHKVEAQRDQLAEQVVSLSKLQTAVEQSPVSIVITDLAAQIEYVNPCFMEITGYAWAEVVGKNPRILQSGQTDKPTYDSMWSALSNGQAWRGELLNKRKSGETYWEEARIAPVINAQGEPTHYVAIKTDVTQRKQLELAHHKALDQIKKIAGRVPGMVYQFRRLPDGSSCFPFASEAIWQIYGLKPEDVQHDAAAVFAQIHPDDRAGVVLAIEQSAQQLSPWQQAFRVRGADQERWLYGDALPEREADGATLWHGFITDITERKKDEEKLKESEERFRVLFNSSPDAYLVIQVDGSVITDCNHAAEAMLGCARAQILGQRPDQLSPLYQPDGRLSSKAMATIIGEAQQSRSHHFEWIHQRADGSDFWVDVSISFAKMGARQVMLVGWRDITERKRAEKMILHMAQHDPLTGLANRALFTDRLQRGLASAQRDETSLALLFIDLDKFKPVNDDFGHAIGDLLLQEVAQRMQACVRNSDTLARIGGDEFVVLLRDVAGELEALAVAEKIRVNLEQPFELAGHSLNISCSVGVALYPQHGADDLILSKRADDAMYQAKERGRNQVVLYRAPAIEGATN